MKETIISMVGDKLKSLEVFIDDVHYEKEGNDNYLRIVLDSEKMIPLNIVVMATRIMNPVLDKADLFDEAYTLDVYAKEKGEI